MTKNDYIEKITKNLEHLTKDELKDVSILTTAQLGVRSKFAERQQLEHEIANLTPQLQQQALPVVPECVAEFIEFAKTEHLNLFNRFNVVMTDEKVSAWLSDSKAYDSGERRDEILARAWLDGYTVEKPQLFKLIFPNSTAVLQKDGELNSFADTVYKRYLIKNAMTEQEIKSIDERYWQFAVPVEDGE